MNDSLNGAAVIGTATTSTAVRPVTVPSPGRGDDLQVRVSAPLFGEQLPVVMFSHGFGLSMDAYGPLVDFWAARGFVVVQPTHLDSRVLDLSPDDPRQPHVWRHRIDDLRRVVDHLDEVVATVPGLPGRVDSTRVAVAGHSYGATTASALLGARVLDPAGDPDESFTDARVRAGVLLCLAGVAGDELSPMASRMFPFMRPDFDHLNAPALIGYGDADQSLLSTRGPDWWTDAYRQHPADKSLLTLFGAGHKLGSIHAYPAFPPEPEENPATVALVQRMTTAYLRTALGVDDGSWTSARAVSAAEANPAGRVDAG